MDPATSFQIFCGAIQLVHFGISTVNSIQRLHNSISGLSSENELLEHETRLLQTSCTQISASLSIRFEGQLTAEQSNLRLLAMECEQTANNILGRVGQLRLTGTQSKWKAAVQHVKTLRQKSKLQQDEAKLRNLQRQLDTRVIVNLWHDLGTNEGSVSELQGKVDVNHLQTLEAFKQMSQESQLAFRNVSNQIAAQLSAQGEEIRELITKQHTDGVNKSALRGLLQSLAFPSMRMRQDEIDAAHTDTCNWIMDPGKNEEGPGSDFQGWLGTGTGLYWISGKPGSGKSTLMKFLATHANLRGSLEQWTEGQQLTILTHFFWKPGTADQKSVNGLLRSLLYQLLHEHEPLVHLIDTSLPTEVFAWSHDQLQTTLYRALDSCQTTRIKVCLFIDGLDEIEGDPTDHKKLVDLIENLSQGRHVKAIVSSRPERLFSTRLSSYPSFRLQDLNKEDILRYVEGRLLEEQAMAEWK
ncbi:MAG: hypothetical protein Q9227_007309, partial [Pyrenula ochraceoflavens]